MKRLIFTVLLAASATAQARGPKAFQQYGSVYFNASRPETLPEKKAQAEAMMMAAARRKCGDNLVPLRYSKLIFRIQDVDYPVDGSEKILFAVANFVCAEPDRFQRRPR